MRTRVYVSGPITIGDPEENMQAGIAAGQELLEAGYAPLVPHLSVQWAKTHDNAWEEWIDMDLAWVALADAVLRIPGESRGAEVEVAHAETLGIPVFYSLDALLGATMPTQPDGCLPPPVDRAILRAISTFTNKNADYADDSSWRSNFDDIAAQEGRPALQVADTMINVKQARLRALRANGRAPVNEALEDTYLDRMVYSIIAYALLLDGEAA